MTTPLAARKQSALFGISSAFVAQALTLATGALSTIVFTRALGAEGRGVYAVLTAAAALLVCLLALGFPTANAYFAAQDDRNTSALLGNSVLLSVALVVVVGAVAASWPGALGAVGIAPSEYRLGTLYLTASLPLLLLSQLLRDLLLGRHWFIQYNASTAAAACALLPLGLLLIAVLPEPLPAVLVASVLSLIVPVVLSLAFLLPHARPSISLGMLGRSMFVAGRAYWINVLVLLLAQLNILLLSRWAGSGPTGLYSAALSLANLVGNLPLAAVPVVFAVSASDQRGAIGVALRANRLVFCAVLVASLAMAAAGGWLLRLFGAEFEAARTALWILLLGVLSHTSVLVLRSCFQGLGYPLSTVGVPLWGLAVNAGASFWLIPSRGIEGAALSLTAAHFVMMLLSIAWVRRRAPGTRWSEFFVPSAADVRPILDRARGRAAEEPRPERRLG